MSEIDYTGLTDNQILTMKIDRMKLEAMDKDLIIEWALEWRKMDFLNNLRLITMMEMMLNQVKMDYESIARELLSSRFNEVVEEQR